MSLSPAGPKRAGRALLSLLAALFAVPGGCTLIFNEDAKQCSSDSDCVGRGGVAFAYSVCDRERNVCVSSIATQDAGDADAPPSDCTEHSDCTHLGPYVCQLGSCQPIKSAACPEVFNTSVLEHPDAFGIGVIAHGYDVLQPDLLGTELANAALLAHGQFQLAAPTISPAAGSHSFVVRCDENQLSDAYDHLRALGVNTVVGPQLAESALELIPKAEGDRVALILPVADDPRLEQGAPLQAAAFGTVWSVRPNRKRELVFVKPILEKAGELLATVDALQFSELRVAYVVGSDPASQALQSQLVLPTGAQTFQYTNVADLAQAIASAQPLPNLIVASSDSDPWNLIIGQIESAWPGAEPKPWYVLRDRWDRVLLDVGTGKIPRRILGITFARSADAESAYQKFVGIYKTNHNNKTPPPKAEYGYDAMALALAGSFLWRTSTSGLEVGRLMKQQLLPVLVPSGPKGPFDDFTESIGAAQVGTDSLADYYGASGDLDFDSAIMSPSEDGTLYCLPKAGFAYCDVGFTFSKIDGTVSGALNSACDCF